MEESKYTYEEIMSILLAKVIEVLTQNVYERVPMTGPFRKVMVTYCHPDSDLRGILAVQAHYESPEVRTVFAGMFREGDDRLIQNFLFDGTKEEILVWLQEKKRIQELLEIYNHLSEKC